MDIQSIITKMEKIAPPWLADEGDPIGLQTGSRLNKVNRIFVTVDVTPGVVAQAEDQEAEMIISHHALIYQPLKTLERKDARMEAIARLVAADISVYAAHTNWDSAPGGINDTLAETLGLIESRVFGVRRTDRLLKIVVYSPPEAVETVRKAMSEAGAGHIGNYSECSFKMQGKGSFKPLEGADPYTGEIGKLEEPDEYRLEMIVPESKLPPVVEAMLAVHPYEEVAYDVLRLENTPMGYGFGRIGRLAKPTSLADFAKFVEDRLEVQGLRMTGEKHRKVERVAICGGGGDFLIPQAHAVGADVYVTGTAGYHRFQDADALGLAFIDAGHFETERPGMKSLAERLKRELAEESIDVKYVE